MMSHIIAPDTEETKLQLLEKLPECEYIVNAGAKLTLVVYSSGKDSFDGNVHVRLVGPGAEAVIVGVFSSTGEHMMKLHTLQHHEAPETTSNLLVKTVLSGHATFFYDGAIRVEKEGQKTDAYQRNENMLLSDNAHAQSKPSLEILANDVRCTHGATIGSINEDQLFYLATRGIGDTAGKRLIVEGFLESALSKISDTIKANTVRKTLWQTLSKRFQ